MLSAVWVGCLALACADVSDEPSASLTIEPIIGGTLASAYPEAAYLNIDLTATGGYACSGVLIAPKVVLTAGHCVDTHSRWEVYVGSAYRLSTDAVTYDWNEQGAEQVNPAHHDIGLVFLCDAVKLASYPTIAKAVAASGAKAINVGRVLNGVVKSGDYQAATTLNPGAALGYPFDYYSTDVIQPGDSGGPVFLSGTHTVAAVNSGSGSGKQVLARTDLLYSWIADQIAAHTDSVAIGAGGAGGAGGAPSSSGAIGAGSGGTAGTAGAAHACKQEVEKNDAWTSANALSGSVCGSLSTATDADFFSIPFAAGAHTVEIVASSDAKLSLGAVSGTTCVLSLSNVTRASVTVKGAAQTLCAKVSSTGKKIQSYQMNAL